jgi:hypothetical protein
MYGRADGMPSFQLTMAVRARCQNLAVYDYRTRTGRGAYHAAQARMRCVARQTGVHKFLQLRATTTGKRKVECVKLGHAWSAV